MKIRCYPETIKLSNLFYNSLSLCGQLVNAKLMMHLENFIPISKADTRRGSTRRHCKSGQRTKAKSTPCRKTQGRNRYGDGERQGSTAQIGKSIRREILLQDKVWKTQEYFVSFKFFKPQYWSKRSAEGRRRIGVVMPTKKKAARLLQQSDGTPRFGKHGR